MQSINESENESIEIVAKLFRIKCKQCHSIWGVYQNEDGDMPEGWNVCLKCEGRKSFFGEGKEPVKTNGNTSK